MSVWTRVVSLFVAQEYIAGRSDPEADRRARPRRRWRKNRCLWLNVTAVLICVVIYMHWRQVPLDLRIFHPSTPVLHAQEALQLQSTLRPWLLEHARRNPKLCGLPAVSTHDYRRYALVYDERSGTYRDVFNPEVLGVDHRFNQNITVREKPLVCHTHNRTIQALRATHVLLRWRDERWEEREAIWTGVASICVQHIIDLFEGFWPCGMEGEDQFRIPVLLSSPREL